jgi:hemolysin activation/secretion protein
MVQRRFRLSHQSIWISSVAIALGLTPEAIALPSHSPAPASQLAPRPVNPPLAPTPSDPILIAQPLAPEDRFLQDAPDPAQPIDDAPVLQPEPTPPPGLPEQPTVSFPIRTLEILGSTIFDDADFAPIIQPLENQTVTLADLQQAADAVTQLYLDGGYLTSRAILVDQPITDGIVRIQVVEGSLADIQIEGLQRLNASYVRDRIELGARTPLRAEQLEEQLRLLRADPLFNNIEASLRASGEVGQSILIVRVDEADPWFGGASIDNYSPPSVGSERIGLDLGYRNVTGLGDSLSISYDRTTRNGANIFDLNYRVPLNAMNGTLALRTVIDRNEIVQSPFNIFGIRGESERYDISVRQPLRRTTREEFALSIGLSHKTGQTFLFNSIPQPFGIGPDADGISRTTVFRIGQDYVRRDVAGAWALRSQFNIGVDLLNATVNAAPIPDGRFVSWLGQVQRVQRLGPDHILILQGDIQLTPDRLLASEQFVIGGGQSVRGYRQNARSGDNGVRLSIEDRITLSRNAAGLSVFQLAPFLDMGAVWNHPDNPNPLPDQTFLIGAGLGALWELAPGLNIRLDYGLPLVDLSDRGNNFQDDGLYFSVDYRF